MFGNFAKIGRAAGASPIWQISLIVRATSHDYLFIISMTKLDTYFSMSTSYSLAKAQSCQTLNQNLLLLFVFSFNSFVQAKFGAFVRIFFQFLHGNFISDLCLKYLSAILFVLGKSLIVLQYN
jgi:hypothetical protein